MSFGEKILNYQDDIMNDLNELIKIRSVSSTDKAAASQALEFILTGKGAGIYSWKSV